jgi:hypothetical protein
VVFSFYGAALLHIFVVGRVCIDMKFLHKVKGTINTATRKSQDVIEVNKINQQIKKQENELTAVFQLIGQKIFQDPEYQRAETKDYIRVQVNNAQYVQKQINELKKKVLYLKDLTKCEVCSKIVPLETKYCPDCGQNITEMVNRFLKHLAVQDSKTNLNL